MAGSGCRNQLSICALRITRLQANGTPAQASATGAVAFVGGIGELKWKADIVAGEKIREVDGCGGLAVVKRYPDRLAAYDLDIDMMVQSYELREIAYDAQLVTVGGSTRGAAEVINTACGSAVAKNGVIVEAWGENWVCDQPDASYPYVRRVFARAFLNPSDGDMKRGNNHLMLSGFTQPNVNANDGPFNDWPTSLMSISDWITAGFDDTALPTAEAHCGYVSTPSQT
jgi:hypothetical protein